MNELKLTPLSPFDIKFKKLNAKKFCKCIFWASRKVSFSNFQGGRGAGVDREKKFVFGYNISYYNTLKQNKELFVFVLLSFFITLINLGAQIQAAQTRYTVVHFGLNQPLWGGGGWGWEGLLISFKIFVNHVTVQYSNQTGNCYWLLLHRASY